MIKIGIDARGIFSNPTSGHAKSTIALYQKLLPKSEFQFIFYSSPVAINLNSIFPNSTNAQLKILDPWGARFFNYETLWTEVSLPLAVLIDRISVLHCPINRLPHILSCKSIANIYDLATLDYHPTLKPDVLKKHYCRVLNKANLVTTCSEFSRQSLLNLAPEISPDKIVTLPLAAPENFITADNINPVKPYILALGQNNHPRKNIPLIIKSFAEFKRLTNHSTILKITGITDCHAKNDLNKIIHEHNLMNEVALEGVLSEQELTQAYQHAQALIYLSQYEGFGLPILEAMQVGCPVIAANLAAIPETAGNAALLVDPNSQHSVALAIKQIIEDLTLRNDLIAKGKTNLQRFSWKISANKLEHLLKEILSR